MLLWLVPFAVRGPRHFRRRLGNRPALTTGTSNGFTARPYRYQTPVVSSVGAVYNVPDADNSGWDATSGSFANVLKNPPLAQQCEAGIDVAVIVDVSGSVAGSQNELAKALTALVDGLEGTPSSVAMFSFSTFTPGRTWNNGDNGPVILPNHPAPQSVQTAAGANTVKGWYSNDGGVTANFTPSGGTNWDAAFLAAAAGNAQYDYDVVFMVTDGNPTFSGQGPFGTSADSQYGNGSLSTFREIERAVLSSNVIKDTGTRVVAIGVGDGVTDNAGHNLSAISGPTEYASGMTLNQLDYIQVGWEDLRAFLLRSGQDLACQASVELTKYEATEASAPGPGADCTRFRASPWTSRPTRLTAPGCTRATS